MQLVLKYWHYIYCITCQWNGFGKGVQKSTWLSLTSIVQPAPITVAKIWQSIWLDRAPNSWDTVKKCCRVPRRVRQNRMDELAMENLVLDVQGWERQSNSGCRQAKYKKDLAEKRLSTFIHSLHCALLCWNEMHITCIDLSLVFLALQERAGEYVNIPFSLHDGAVNVRSSNTDQ